MDIFLGRCLKNWTAHLTPRKDGRERLLRAAAPYAKDRAARLNSSRELPHHTSYETVEYDPFHMGKLWSLYTLTTLRVIPFGTSDIKYGTLSSITGNTSLMYPIPS